MSSREYGDVIQPRLDAVERVFGRRSDYFVSPIPLYLDGGVTFAAFPNAVPGCDVYCTSEMTGDWGSEQLPGPHGEYELCMVLRKASPLAPVRDKNGVSQIGRALSVLQDLAKHSRNAVFSHGETAGPLHPDFSPMEHVLFVDLTTPKKPFEFLGSKYGITLIVLITDSEREYSGEHGADSLIKMMRKAGVFPVSDITRAAVA